MQVEDKEKENTKSHKLEAKKPYRYDYDAFSYLTLGGWDDNDFNGTLVWYDTTDNPEAWNITAAVDVTFSDTNSWTGDMPALNF